MASTPSLPVSLSEIVEKKLSIPWKKKDFEKLWQFSLPSLYLELSFLLTKRNA